MWVSDKTVWVCSLKLVSNTPDGQIPYKNAGTNRSCLCFVAGVT